MNAWSKLPNAKHIDWVLASLKSNIDTWNQAYDQALDQARIQASIQARNQVWEQVRNQTWYEAWHQAYEQSYDQAWEQARDVLLALIAYDDCDQYLCMTYNELKTWALVSEKPQAILLLSMVYVKEQTNECLV